MEMDVSLVPTLIDSLRDRIGVLELEKIIAETQIKHLEKHLADEQERLYHLLEEKDQIIEKYEKDLSLTSNDLNDIVKEYDINTNSMSKSSFILKDPQIEVNL